MKGLQRKTPLRQRSAFGRMPAMGRVDGAGEAVRDGFPEEQGDEAVARDDDAASEVGERGGCTFSVAGVCNYDPKTVVLVHMRWLGDCGGSLKPADLQAAYGCSERNRWTDSPSIAEARDRPRTRRFGIYALRALVRTQLRMVAKGLITVKGIAA